MKSYICVFAGSKPGSSRKYIEAAEQLANEIVSAGYGLVYGGAQVGLMGALANRFLKLGAPAIGVIPEVLVSKEVAHPNLTELRVVDSMHERKAQMADLASGFVAVPGGFGTFEELLEIVTWAQLGFHRKPVGILNVYGYFTQLLEFLDHAVEEGFLKPEHRALLIVDKNPGKLVEKMAAYEPPAVKQWLDREET